MALPMRPKPKSKVPPTRFKSKPTKKIVSKSKILAEKRQVAARKAVKLKQLRTKKVAASKRIAVKKPATRKAPRVTRKSVQSDVAKAAAVRTKTVALKNRARVKATKAGNDLRAQLKKKATSNMVEAKVKLTGKLNAAKERYNNARNGSNRTRATSAGGEASTKHAGAKYGSDISSQRGADARGKRDAAKAELDSKTQDVSRINEASTKNNDTHSGVDKGRQEAAGRRESSRGEAEKAAGIAEGQRAGGQATGNAIQGKKGEHAALDGQMKAGRDRVAAKETDAAGAAADAQRHTAVGSAASGTAANSLQRQGSHDASRIAEANNVKSHDNNAKAANIRKTENQTALSNAQATHQASVSRMTSNADGAARSTGGQLNDANAAGARQRDTATGATASRSGKEGDAAGNATAITGKRQEVSDAQASATTARSDHDAKVADVNSKNATLADLGSRRPGLEADSRGSRAAADAAAPKRPDTDSGNAARRDDINDSKIPAAKNEKVAAAARHDAVSGELAGHTTKKAANEAELASVVHDIPPLRNKDGSLRSKKDVETAAMADHVAKRDAAASDIAGKNNGLNSTAIDADRVKSIIDQKKVESPTAPPRDNPNDIPGKQTTAAGGMTAEGTVHAVSARKLADSEGNVGTQRNALDKTGAEVNSLGGKRNDLTNSRDTELANTTKHDADRATATGRAKDTKTEAADAATRAEGQRAAGQTTGDAIQGKKGEHAALDGPVSGVHDAIRVKKNKAEAEGNNAKEHLAAHDAAELTARKRDGDRADMDSQRSGAAADVVKQTGEHTKALSRKSDAENSLSEHQASHAAAMNNINSNPQGALRKHGKDLDNARDSVNTLDGKAVDTRAARSRNEAAAADNKVAIVNKRNEVSSARGHEANAKNRHAADAEATVKNRQDLDDYTAAEPGLKGARDSASPEGIRSQRRADEAAMISRKDQIEGDISLNRRAKDDAADVLNREKEKAAKLRGDKEGLPREDGSALHLKDSSLNRKKAKELAYNNELKAGKKKVTDNIAEKRRSNIGSMMALSSVSFMIGNLLNNKLNINPADILGPGISNDIGFTYPGAGTIPGESTIDADTGSTVVTISADPMGEGKSQDYIRGYNVGKVVGAQDGQRDGTADAITPNTDQPDALQSQLTVVETNDNAVINSEIAKTTNNTFCKEVQTQGVADGIDINTEYPECAEYFQANPIMAATGADKSMTGGYMENAEGVMQFGGAVVAGPAEPSDEYDAGYSAGYDAAYKAAYTQAYSLTIAIRKTNTVVTPPPGYGELAAAAIKASAAVPTTEAAAVGPKGKGASGASGAASGAASEASGAASGAQAGGALKQAKRKYKRGKTFTQHAHLIDKIRGRTIVV